MVNGESCNRPQGRITWLETLVTGETHTDVEGQEGIFRTRLSYGTACMALSHVLGDAQLGQDTQPVETGEEENERRKISQSCQGICM